MADRESLAGVERLRTRLQENMQMLQKALRHWQTWEAEYEGLKEELEGLPANTTEKALSRIAEQYHGDLITEKEIKELFGQENGWLRSPRQITDLITRRIDYVQRNVETLKKQCAEVESRLDNIAIIVQPEARNEDGLPIQDIYEELDDEGNVVSGKVSQPGDAESKILGVLEKVGLKSEDISQGPEVLDPAPERDGAVETEKKASVSMNIPSAMRHSPSTSIDVSTTISEPSRPRKKSVSFAADTKEPPSVEPTPTVETNPPYFTTIPITRELSELAKGTFTDADRVIELDEGENPIAVKLSRQPIDESPEAARLRRQMLEYNLREVGEIVAQIDLEEDDDRSDSVMDEDDEDEDEDYDMNEADEASVTESGEDENEWGMSRNGVITEAYRKEMLELEQRLKARMFENLGPSPNVDSSILSPSVVPKDVDAPPASTGNEVREKSVRFATGLDVAPAPRQQSPTTPTSKQNETETAAAPPIKDTIVEHAPKSVSSPPSSDPPRKQSRFKASRQAVTPPPDSQPMPHRSAINPLAPRIIERPVKTTSGDASSRASQEPDEFDHAVQRQQVVDEYFKTRNKLVRREGGFSRRQYDEEEAEVTDDDDVDVPGKKVSLFKAARVRGLGCDL